MADSSRRLVVLLIDDQAIVGTAIAGLLSSEADVDFHHCRRAADALDVAEAVRPSIILLDLVMEDVSGLALLHRLRTSPATAAIPIVMLSGHEDAETRRQTRDAGAVDYLVKMPEKAALLACIRRCGVPGSSAAAPMTPQRPGETLDLHMLQSFREADGGDALARILIDQFLDEGTTHVAGLKDAAARLDLDTIGALAHGLKGSANMMGATSLAALCGQMEQHAKRRVNRIVISVLMADIERALAAAQQALLTEREALDPR